MNSSPSPTAWVIRVLFCHLILCSAALAQFRFVHASDTHVNPYQTPDSNAARNAKLFAEISTLDPKPAFVICTGDIVEVGAPVEYGYLKDALKNLAIPFYPAPGNHDVRWNPLGKEGFVKGTGHPLFQTFDHGGVQFFLLDSTVLLEHWGHISQQQLDWLKAELEKIGTEKPVVIGFHHWIGRDKVQIDNEQELIDLVEPYNVVLWLQGHGHSDIEWNVNGVPAIMQKGLYQGSYSVIDVQQDKLVITRRKIVEPKKNKELLRDKSVPAEEKVEWEKVGEWPLKRNEEFSFDVEVHPPEKPGEKYMVSASNAGQFPLESKAFLRVDGAPWKEIEAAIDTFVGEIDLGRPSGQHQIDIRVELPDGRTFTKNVEYIYGKPAAWQVLLSGAVQSRLVRHGDALYVTTMAGDLVSIDPKNGKINWTYKTGDSIFSTPRVENDTVYVGSADHHVHAVRRSDGSPLWKFKTEGAVLAGAAVAKGVVCIGSADTTIYGLDAATGSLRWRVQGGNLYQSKAATDGTHFFVGGWDNYFRCIDAETGREVWKLYLGREQKMLPQFSAFAPAIASPAVGDGLVYVSTNDGILHAIDIATGQEAWKIDRKKMGYSSPLSHDGVVYGCLSDESKVFAADAKTGGIKWEKETGRVVYDSSFCWANGLVAIGAVDGTLMALDAETGEKAWEYKVDHGHLLASPAADDQFVYIATMLGRVNAVPIGR